MRLIKLTPSWTMKLEHESKDESHHRAEDGQLVQSPVTGRERKGKEKVPILTALNICRYPRHSFH